MSSDVMNILIKAQDMASGVMKGVAGNVDDLGNKMKKIGDSMKGFGQNMTAFVTLPVIGAGGAMLKAASDAEETRNRFNAVFRGIEGQANSFADTLASSVGRSKYTIRDGLASFQGFALGLGMSQEAAFEFSTTLQKMSIDFASFNNISDTEAQSRFIAAMSGSSEVLDQFGVNIREAQIELQLAEMGINKTSQSATEMEKAVARLNIIKDVMGSQGAMGDAVTTANSAANTFKKSQAQFNDLAVTLGQQLLPVAIQLIQKINEMVAWFQALSPSTQQAILVFLGMVAVLGPLLMILGSVIGFVGTLITVLGFFGIAGTAVILPILGIIAAIGLLIGTIIWLIFNWEKVSQTVKSVWNTVSQIVSSAITGLIATFASRAVAVANGFTSMFNGIGNGVSGIFKGVFNSIIGTINGGLRQVNGLIDKLPEIPGIGKISKLPEIPKFANGGIVGGSSTTGDKILARVNSGEVILNQKQQESALAQMSGSGEKIVIQIDKFISLGTEKDKRSFVSDIADALELELRKRKIVTL